MAEERVRRRLAAILAADVAGYSRLVGDDEEGTLASLAAHRARLVDPRIAEYGGRIANTAGDSILAEFPSVVEALRCAIDIQSGMLERNADTAEERRIEFRIGLNLGDVIERDGDLLGDGVNVAARLEALAEPGGTTLSRAARDQVRDRLPVVLDDMGEVEVKNIQRLVRVFRLARDNEQKAVIETTKSSSHIRARAALVFTIVLAGGVLLWWEPWAIQEAPMRPERIAHPIPDKPSIAVLPFSNLSGDPEQEYFADGFADDLITNLAQSSDLFVAARNSSFTYKGKAVKVREVAEELGVRYVLEGSIRRLGVNIRITAQLIDVSTGAHVWAKRYDEPADKLFDVQDEVAREIAGTLLANINLVDLARSKQKRPSELSAHDYVLQARARYALRSRATTMEARELAEKAIAADPEYAPGYAILGDTYNSAYILQLEGAEALDHAYTAARNAVELDPQLSEAHELLGRVLLRRGQHDEAIASLERSIDLNPNRSDNYASLADTLTFANRAGEAIDLLQKAMRLDPFYSPRYDMYLGRAYYFVGRYGESITELKNCAIRAPKFRPCYMYLAPAYAEAGNHVDARQAVDALLKLSPEFSISSSVEGHLPFVPAALEFYVDGLRKAGVPK